MRCHKCDEGVLQIAALTPPDEGWAVGCNKCDYSTWKSTADQMIIEQPLTHEEKQIISYIRKQASFIFKNRELYKNPDARYSALLYFASCIEEGLHRSIEYDPIEFGE